MSKATVPGEHQGSVLFRKVYYIDCSEEDAPHLRHSITPLAIRPVFNGRTHTAHWATNSSRGEYVFYDRISGEVEQYQDDPKALGPNVFILDQCPDEIVLSNENHTMRLLKLTKQLFDQKVRPFVMAGETLSFTDDASVQKYFLETQFER